jgi:hypothetical protein
MILAADVADYPGRWGHMSEQSVKNSVAAGRPGWHQRELVSMA